MQERTPTRKRGFPASKSQFGSSGAGSGITQHGRLIPGTEQQKSSLRPVLKQQEEPQTADLRMEELHWVLSALPKPLDNIINIPKHLLC